MAVCGNPLGMILEDIFFQPFTKNGHASSSFEHSNTQLFLNLETYINIITL